MKIPEKRWLLAAVASLAAASLGGQAEAFPIRVLAGSDLHIEPHLAADRSTLSVAIKLQDDRGQAISDGSLVVTLRGIDGARETLNLTTNSQGEATHTIPLRREQGGVDVSARYAGDELHASRAADIHVNLNAPYVTIDLVAPPNGVELGPSTAMFYVQLQVGDVVSFQAQNQGVEVRERDRTLAGGLTDLSGRVALPILANSLGPAGVHRVRAFTLVQGERVEGPERELLVRAHTHLSLVRVSGEDEGGVELRGALVTREGVPVRDASVRVMRGTQTLVGARTDERGGFVARMGNEVLAEHDVNIRALFEPTEPWYIASESDALQLTPPAPETLHWGWAVAPALLAALGVLAMFLRGRDREEVAAPAAVTPRAFEDRIEHLPSAPRTGLRVRFVVTDRASAAAVVDAAVRRAGETTWSPITEASVALQPSRKIEFEVGASGYAVRRVTGEFSRPGEYVVRVQLRTWREELFERARPWLRRAGVGPALPTLREALKTRASTPSALEFVALIEEGCYAPPDPSAREVARADELTAVFEAQPTIRED